MDSLGDLPPPPPPFLIEKLDDERGKRKLLEQRRAQERGVKQKELDILEKLEGLHQKALAKAERKRKKRAFDVLTGYERGLER